MRLLVALHSHSGDGGGPRYGDLEAQRHWMEVTAGLEVGQWYCEGPDNELLYWGLDYPPLTAYHSRICAAAVGAAAPDAVALHSSRGAAEGEKGRGPKLLLRTTVILSEAFVFIPPLIVFFWDRGGGGGGEAWAWTFQALLEPCLLLVDHGHFQYNAVSLGLSLAAIVCIGRRAPLLASIFFVAASQFKIMAVYYAPVFFFYVLSGAYHRGGWRLLLWRFVTCTSVALLCLAVLWAPFLASGTAACVLDRIFPVGRGLYEDKVANFWCSLEPVLKAKRWPRRTAVLACAVATAMALVAPCVGAWRAGGIEWWNGGRQRFVEATAASALAFFLWAYHVHEKTFLLPLLPLILLGDSLPYVTTVSVSLGLFSMYPLLARDGLAGAYLVTGVLHAAVSLPRVSTRERFALALSWTGAIAIHGARTFIGAPERYPDIWDLATTSYACVHFAAVYAFLAWRLVTSWPSLGWRKEIANLLKQGLKNVA